ncbi:hypothetical protein [Streptomyces sp. NPDC059819]|uniref:hypothetical protein n=1 Tax=Streptomyces sp. NPDC059819 TaxID=3346963 RepID=UPI00364BD2FB
MTALRTEIQPGDHLRLLGTLIEADALDGSGHLTVDILEVLAPAPARALREMVADRYGDDVVIFDADTDTVPVFTADGLLERRCVDLCVSRSWRRVR